MALNSCGDISSGAPCQQPCPRSRKEFRCGRGTTTLGRSECSHRCRRSNPKTNFSRLTLESPTRIPAFWLTPKVPKVVAKPPTREAPIVVDDLTVCPDGFLLQGNTLLIPCGQNTTRTPSFRGSVYLRNWPSGIYHLRSGSRFPGDQAAGYRLGVSE